MKKFNLSCKLTISAYTEVEADNLVDAIKIASRRENCHIHIDSSYSEDECWIIDELDGMAYDIKES